MRWIAISLVATAVAVSAPAAAQNLVVNGSFEAPVQVNGSYTDYIVGSNAITGWQVVGVPGTYVTVLNQNYAGNPGFSFPAQQGSQWLDLAGFSDNAPNGVSQSIATLVNATYQLSFYVGNVTGGPNNAFGTQSSVGVEFSSGGTNFSCTNNSVGSTLLWQLCTQQFVATSALTTFTLRNLDPGADFSNAVDNVSFVQLVSPSGVPEPATWGMMLIGFGAMGFVMRRRSTLAARVHHA